MKYIVSHWLNSDSRLVLWHCIGRTFRPTKLNQYSFSAINDVGATVVCRGPHHRGWCYGGIVWDT